MVQLWYKDAFRALHFFIHVADSLWSRAWFSFGTWIHSAPVLVGNGLKGAEAQEGADFSPRNFCVSR